MKTNFWSFLSVHSHVGILNRGGVSEVNWVSDWLHGWLDRRLGLGLNGRLNGLDFVVGLHIILLFNIVVVWIFSLALVLLVVLFSFLIIFSENTIPEVVPVAEDIQMVLRGWNFQSISWVKSECCQNCEEFHDVKLRKYNLQIQNLKFNL